MRKTALKARWNAGSKRLSAYRKGIAVEKLSIKKTRQKIGSKARPKAGETARQKVRRKFRSVIPQAVITNGYEEGRRDGYTYGSQYGIHLGGCEAVVSRRAPEPERYWNVHIFYVREGFVSLDEGIIAALRGLVKEVTPLQEGEDAASMAALLRPNLVLVLNGTRFPPAQVDALREQGIRTVVWMVDDPYHSDISAVLALHYDIVLTHEMNCVAWYRELGCPQVHYLPLAAGMELYTPKKVEIPYHTDICFIANGFWNRIAFIEQVAPFLSQKKTLIAGWWWDRLGNYELLKDKIRPNINWLPPEETASFYNGAKIVINLHRADQDPANFNSRGIVGHSINPRTYEICASGAFQLTDSRTDLAQLYVPGREIVTYESSQDFIDKASYYLEHDGEREAIALRGLRRTMEQHTYSKRLQTLLQILFP